MQSSRHDDYERRFALFGMTAGALCAASVLSTVLASGIAPNVIPGAAVATLGCFAGLGLAWRSHWRLGVRVFLWSCALAIGPSAAAELSGEAALSAGVSWLLLGVFASLLLNRRELLTMGAACTLGTAFLVVWVERLGLSETLQPGGILTVVFVGAGYATLAQIAGYFRETLARTQDAEQAALEALEARGQFMATMSHELRTPLNAVLGYSELLLDDTEEPQVREDLERIHWSANLLLGHINAILDLSKLEAGQMDIVVEDVHVARLVTSVLEQHRPLMETNGNQAVLDVPEDLVFSTDGVKLLQIITNLVTNADKFTENGTITVRATPDRGGVRIEVSDTGLGMTPDVMARVFEPFAQADSTTTRRFGGTGLGLTLVKRFAELLGGAVAVESLPGVGTTFSVWLPSVAGPTARSG